jgi:diguanylate cyclase (GGDEF)-like protein/PAS domain S-box-containing protein
VLLVNAAFAQMLGSSVDELRTGDQLVRRTHPDDRARDASKMEELRTGSGAVVHWDKRFLHADGHVVWARVSASVLRETDGEPRCYVAVTQDITDQHEQEAQLLQRACHDPLTGLLNRAAFAEHAHEQIVRSNRYGEHAGLLVLDLDRLKEINDRHGHVVGDQALVAVADALRARLREGDVAARIGGDEFVVLLPHTDPTEARVIADDVTSILAKTQLPGAHDLPLSVSVGSTEILAGTRDIEPTLAQADRAMYAEKRRHRAAGHG